jgi:hypothetical protein
MLLLATTVPVMGSPHEGNSSSMIPGDGTTSTISSMGSISDGSLNLTIKITGGLGVNVVVTNDGAVNLTNIPCLIHVEGGILGIINNTVEGVINSIPVGNTTSVGLTVLGVGPIRITAQVADEELTATGFVFLIFVLGIQ